LRNLIHDLINRLGEVRLPSTRPLLASFRAVIGGVVDRLGALGPRRRRWAIVGAASEQFREGFGALRSRLRASRLGRSADGIIVVPLLGAVLILGVFTAAAATRAPSDTGSVRSSTTRHVSVSVAEAEVITETITRGGETIRIIRRTPGRVETISGRSVTLPGSSVTVPGNAITLPGQTHTVVETKTRTRTVTDSVTTTVTETQTETVTETVTEPGPPD
jgi:hypothetical protein